MNNIWLDILSFIVLISKSERIACKPTQFKKKSYHKLTFKE